MKMIENTREQVSEWFDVGLAKGATHMLIVCDTVFYKDEPAYVMPEEDVRATYDEYENGGVHRVKAVYALHLDKQYQLDEQCPIHLEQPDIPGQPSAVDLEQEDDLRERPTAVIIKKRNTPKPEATEAAKKAEEFLKRSLGLDASKHKGLLTILSGAFTSHLGIDWKQVEMDASKFAHLVVKSLGPRGMGRMFEASLADPSRLLLIIETCMQKEMKCGNGVKSN